MICCLLLFLSYLSFGVLCIQFHCLQQFVFLSVYAVLLFFVLIHSTAKKETKKWDCFIVANGFQRVFFEHFSHFFFFLLYSSFHLFGCIKSSQVHRAYFNVEKWCQFLKWNDNDIAVLATMKT